MAFGFIQSNSGQNNPVTDYGVAFDSAVTAGSLLIAAAYWSGASETATVDDTPNGSWTAVGSPHTGLGGLSTFRIQMFYKIGAAAGATTPTLHVTGTGSSVGLAVHEYSVGSTPSVDGTPDYNDDSSTPWESSAVVTTAAGAMLFSMCVSENSVSGAGVEMPDNAAANFRENTDFGSNGTEDYLNAGSAGSKSMRWTTTGGNSIGIIAFKEGGSSAQLLLPSADSVDGNWTDQSGGTSLAAAIDESTASDTDYIRSELGPSNSACRVKLAAGGDPQSSTGHILHWRVGKDITGGASIAVTCKLYQGGGNSIGGGTLIKSWTRSNVDAFTTYDEAALSSAEADSITNYSDLYLEFSANQT